MKIIGKFFLIGIFNFIFTYFLYLLLLLNFNYAYSYTITLLVSLFIMLLGNIIQVFNKRITLINSFFYLIYYVGYSVFCFYILKLFIEYGVNKNLAPLAVQSLLFYPNFIVSKLVINYASE